MSNEHRGRTALTRRDFAKTALLAGGACLLAAGPLAPGRAQAATEETLAALSGAQAEYEAAMAELQSITSQLEAAQYNLAECQANLQQTNDQIAELETSIAQKQAELLEAQQVLADRVGASYRAGTSNLLEVLLDSTDFEDFVSRLYYANKVSDADAQAIDDVKTLKADLETQEAALQEQRATQEQLLADQQDYTDQLAATESYYSSYTAGLSSEVAALIEQAQQETIAQQQAEAAARAAQEAQAGGSASGDASNGGASAPADSSGSTDAPSSGDGGSNGGGSTDNGGTSGGGSDSGGDGGWSDDSGNSGNSGGSSSSGGSGNHVPSVASIAWNYCGVPYVWGGSDPSGFDCSGLTQYCYAQAGYSIGRDTYSQAANISSCGQMVYSMSQLSAGDLIFPHSGHVGIYEGGGCLIDAPYEGQVVQYRSCWFSDCFGGCPV